ncbi:ferrous iron transporter B [bacterium]|nr:ferrous iron transporter B [bacterium]
MGNPNVGKSVIFSRLTGAHVISSNYPGTTVTFTKGNIWIDEERHEIIDVPGTYTLKPTSKAEKVAVEMLKEGDLIINVIDATNLERSLYLTTQLMETGFPIIIALNMWDDVKHKGIKIEVEKLKEFFKCPVIPTVAVTSQGIKDLVSATALCLKDLSKSPTPELSDEERWAHIGQIIRNVQQISHRHHTALERLCDITIKPLTGIPFAFIVIGLSFIFIRFLGEGLINYILHPAFERYYVPFIVRLVNLGFPSGIIHNILLGESANFVESMGLLTTGIYVPVVMVLPYVFSFYLILSFLEDLGYLPRFAVLMDTIMHRIGLHGFAVISIILGLGCNVPGALSTRILETRREKFIAGTLLGVSVPCMAQTAMIISLIGPYGNRYIFLIYAIIFAWGIFMGLLLDRILKGGSPEIFIEIPSYHIPHMATLFKKLWMRIKGFLDEAVPLVLLGVLIINILHFIGLLDVISRLATPALRHILGLPKDVVSAMIIGFLRKDVAIGLLKPLDLSLKQLIIACTVLTIYFPCLATFFVLLKELGLKDMVKSACLMIASALIVGFMLNLAL